MKSLPVKNPAHIRLESGFRDWLELMGYAASSVYGMPNYLREFFHWLETHNKVLKSTTPQEVHTYFFQLKRRRNRRRPGTLSTNHLKKHLHAIRRFSHYLKETDQGILEVNEVITQRKTKDREVLTRAEITRLYAACTRSPLGMRDRAMLSVFYGCGLRRTEGVMLDAADFLAARNLLYVRRAKGYKERYVPLSETVRMDLNDYLMYGRPSQLRNTHELAFFISQRGTRPQGQSLYLRLKLLIDKSGIEKDIGLHALRHSIATHLLQSGMELPSIAAFLGHRSLESTQIYTQISL